MVVDLGLTLNEILGILNTASKDTQDIIKGTKILKKVKLGERSTIEETEETEGLEPIKVITEEADGYNLKTGKNKDTGLSSYSGRLSLVSRLQEINENGLSTKNQEAIISIKNADGTARNEKISLYTQNKLTNKTAQISLANGKIIFSATDGIEGLPANGGLDISPASIEYDNLRNGLSVRNDEGSLYFNAEDTLAFNSNKDVTIERAGMNGVNVNSSGIYIYDENVDTGNCANINFEDGIISLSSDNKIDFSGRVDFTNATVMGLSSGGDAIVDVIALPTENVNENVIYRVPSAMFYNIVEGKLPIGYFLCNVVDTLPEVGNPAVVFDASYNPIFIEGYYVTSENKAYGYVNDMLSQIGASLGQPIPVGWYPLEVLFPIINQSYGGIINSLNQATDLQSIYLLVEYGLFIYKNGRYSQPSVDTNADFTWCGSNTFENIAIFEKNTFFNGAVDFSNATVTGLPSNGGSGGSIDTTADFTWEGDHRFNGNVQFFADCGMDYINCDTEAKFNGDAYFYGLVNFSNGEVTFNNGLVAKGNVDFTNATEVKVGSNLFIGSRGASLNEQGYLDITDPENIYLWIGSGYNSSIDIYGDYINYDAPQHNFSGSVDFTNATVTGLPSGGSLDLDADYNWNGNHTFNNGITLNSSITLPNDGFIDVGDDYVEINHPQLTLSSNNLYIYANQSENSAIEILAGENDDTYFYISPSGLDVTANNGNIDFTTGNQGSISFTANGEESASGINIYDSSIEYNAQNHTFFGEVDFSDATVTGLPSSGGGKTKITISELKSMLNSYSTNRGKLIQFVYKGTTSLNVSSMINAVGLVQITNTNTIYKKIATVEMTESAIAGFTYKISISNTATYPYMSYQTWERNLDDGTSTIDSEQTFTIDDTDFDIYVIGG